MKYRVYLPSLAALSLLLSACGGGSGGGGTSAAPPAPAAATGPVNVALPANGATVSATYGGTTANFVNDGDSATTTNFWTGNVADDAVTIDFGRLRQVTEVTVYTNDLSFSSSSPKKYIEVSADNITWKTTAQVTGGDVGCSTYSSGSGKIRCVLSPMQSIRYFRVRVTAVAPSTQNIVEMEAVGT